MAALDNNSSSEDLLVRYINKRLSFRMEALHAHDGYELYYLQSGEASYTVEGRLFPLNPGDLVLVRPSELHAGFAGQQPCVKRYQINIRESVFVGIPYADCRSSLRGLFCQRVLHIPPALWPEAEEHLKKIRLEASSPRMLNEILLQLYTLEFLIFVLRLQDEERLTPYDNGNLTQATEVRFVQAMYYMNAHFREELTIQTVAMACGISDSYFSRMFKQAARIPFSQYLNGLRVREAQRLLSETDMPISEIAGVCGFGGSVYFAKVFKELTETSPRTFRCVYQKSKS